MRLESPGQQTRASLLEEKFVSSWVLESYSSLRVYRPHWEQGSGTISPKCFEWNPAPLARQILCDRGKYFSVRDKVFAFFSKVRESLWFKLRLRHGQHSAAISYMNTFWTSNQLWSDWNTRQSKQCGFSIYIFDNSKSKSMVRLVRAEKMVLSGLVFARKIARMILIQNI